MNAYKKYKVEWDEAAPSYIVASSRNNAIEKALTTVLLPYAMTNLTKTQKRKHIVSCCKTDMPC